MLAQFEFIFLFLPTLLFAFDRVREARGRMRLLLAASLGFYLVAGRGQLAFLLGSIAVNYLLGRRLSAHGNRWLLALGLALNVGPLVAIKLGAAWPAPPGLSFFALAQAAFLIDAAAGRTREDDPLRYGLFVSFFPSVLAGPIARHAQLAPALERAEASPSLHARAVWRVACGVIQKAVIADTLAPVADALFNGNDYLPWANALTGLLAYALQLYFDFAGYSNIAIGVAAALGVELPENFDAPYRATSIAEFWRSWHISLSQWLRDYVYLPVIIVAGRVTVIRASPLLIGGLASVVTMLTCGLWHGATPGFLAWGAGHGLLLAAHQAWRELLGRVLGASRRRWLDASRVYALLSWALTITCVIALWVPFRAKDLATCQRIARSVNLPGSRPEDAARACVAVAAAIALFPAWRPRRSWPWLRERVERYLFDWRSRAFRFALAAYVVLVSLMVAFYTTHLDRWLVRAIPIATDPDGVDWQFGDFRSNLLAAEIFQGDERKVIICGSSFARQMGVFRFEKDGVRYKSGTVAIVGNGLSNGLMEAVAIVDTPDLDTIFLAIAPINCGPITHDTSFGPQGKGSLARLGFDRPRKPFAELEPIAMSPLDVLQLALTYRTATFFQLHGFLSKLSVLAPRPSPEIQELPFTPLSGPRFEQDFTTMLAPSRREQRPIADTKNGSDVDFKWAQRGCIESLRPGGDIRRALAALKRLCDEHHVRLILYNTPTAEPKLAPHVWTRNFLPEFNAELKRMADDLHVEYEDCAFLFPYSGEWFYDFLHLWDGARELLHKHLLYKHLGAKT